MHMDKKKVVTGEYLCRSIFKREYGFSIVKTLREERCQSVHEAERKAGKQWEEDSRVRENCYESIREHNVGYYGTK